MGRDMITNANATGLALATVRKHAETRSDLVLYGSWFCPFVQRVWIALEAKGIDYQYVEIDPYDKTPEFLAINPRGLVPAIRHNGTCLYETIVLLEYLEEAFPGKKPFLPPLDDAVLRATCRIWVDHISKKVVPAFYQLLQCVDPSAQGQAQDTLLFALKQWCDAFPSDEGPFFLGQQLSMVDCTLAPFALRFKSILHFYRGFEVPAEFSTFHRWLKAIQEHESVKATMSDDSELVKIYKRYADNTAQSEVAEVTRKGTVLP